MQAWKETCKKSSKSVSRRSQRMHERSSLLKRLVTDLVNKPIAPLPARRPRRTASGNNRKDAQYSVRTGDFKKPKSSSRSIKKQKFALQNLEIDSDDDNTYYTFTSDTSFKGKPTTRRSPSRKKNARAATAKSRLSITKHLPKVKPYSNMKSSHVSEQAHVVSSSPMKIKSLAVVCSDINYMDCGVKGPSPGSFIGVKNSNVRPVDRIPIAPYTKSPETNRSLRGTPYDHEPSKSVIRRITRSFLDTPEPSMDIGHPTVCRDKRAASVVPFSAFALSYRSPSPAMSERRLGARSTESVFKYKHVMVKKTANFIQVILDATVRNQRNVLTVKALKELTAVLNNAKYDDMCAVVLITGSDNGTFCSGLDLTYLTTGDIHLAARTMSDTLVEFVRTALSFPKPLVAAVNGQAVGCGVALLPLCDVVYASDKATFFTPYTQLNQVPEAGLSCSLSQVIGIALANEMLMAGRMLTALEAYQMGLVAQVFWPTSMMQEVIPRITNMATACSSRVLNASKSLIRSQYRERFLAACHSEASMQVEIWSTPECQRNMKVFLEHCQSM